MGKTKRYNEDVQGIMAAFIAVVIRKVERIAQESNDNLFTKGEVREILEETYTAWDGK